MPNVAKEALERLIQEGDLRSSWPDLEVDSDDAAADVLRKASTKLRELRQEESLNRWFLGAVWIAGGALLALLGNAYNPAAWYEWPLLLIAGIFLAGIPLVVVYGATVLLHDWWERYGGM
jgi:hypothetical protein